MTPSSPDMMYASPPATQSNPWFAISIGLLGLIVGYSLGTGFTPHSGSGQLVQNPSGEQVSSAAAALGQPAGTPPKIGVGPSIGVSSAKVTLIEFTDFQCPFCGRHYQQTFGQIKKDYVDTGKIKYEIRNFPLSSIHPNAEIGAETAMCADKQGKFWEMHEKLFTNQDAWSAEPDPTATLEKYATDIGLNATQFNTCLTTHATKDAVAKDTADGSAAGINGTPGFWILGPNGKTQQISGAYPYATFQTDLDAMLKS